jgi:hypothetical protein
MVQHELMQSEIFCFWFVQARWQTLPLFDMFTVLAGARPLKWVYLDLLCLNQMLTHQSLGQKPCGLTPFLWTNFDYCWPGITDNDP